MDAPEQSGRFVCIGEVVKAVGLKGEVKLYPLLDYFPPLLESEFLIWGNGELVNLVRHRQAGSCEALKLRGVDDRNAAESLVGKEIGFRSARYLDPGFPRPEGGLPFRYLDREVVLISGEPVGKVVEVRLAGGNYLLVLDDPSRPGREVLVPAVEPILIPNAGLTGSLVIDPPEGLLDVQDG